MNKTSIEWTHRPETRGAAGGMTWNPIRAHRKDQAPLQVKSSAGRVYGRSGTFCTRISPGCTHCYASTINKRFGNELEFTVPNLEKIEFFIDERILNEPLKQKKPCTIFVGDMFDLFHEAIPHEFILQVLAVIAACPQHTFQLLTKRAQRALNFFGQHRLRNQEAAAERLGFPVDDFGNVPDWCEYNDEFSCYVSNSISGALGEAGVGWPMRNLWLGVSVEDQQRADERIPLLLQTPAAVRFLSVEPMLEAVNLTPFVLCNCGVDPWNDQFTPPWGHSELCPCRQRIDWVICGGESGPVARPFNPAWAKSLLERCKYAGVPFFMKQYGSYPIPDPRDDRSISGYSRRLQDRKGGDPEEWIEELRVREFPARP